MLFTSPFPSQVYLTRFSENFLFYFTSGVGYLTMQGPTLILELFTLPEKPTWASFQLSQSVNFS